jgi:hypothetical protein
MIRRTYPLGILLGLLAILSVPGMASAQLHRPLHIQQPVNFGPFYRGVANAITVNNLLPPVRFQTNFAYNPFTGTTTTFNAFYNRYANASSASLTAYNPFLNTYAGIGAYYNPVLNYNPYATYYSPYAYYNNPFNYNPYVYNNPYAYNPYTYYNPYTFNNPYAYYNPYTFYNPYAALYSNFNPYGGVYSPVASYLPAVGAVNPYAAIPY